MRARTSLLLFFPALLAQAPGVASRLELDRAAVARGEVWRLLTGHWTHWTLDHFLWDSLAFLALAVLCETLVPRRLLLATVMGSALAVSAGVWLALPDIGAYRGLSGIDSALFVLLALTLPGKLARVALAAFLAKILWEVSTGSILFAEADSFVPVPLAHLIGGAWGLAMSLIRLGRTGPPAAPATGVAEGGGAVGGSVLLSRVCSGNSPAASGPGADLWGRPRSGRSSSR
jgi:rhomboid family GlyGly-CTERM serine protease